MRLTLNDDETRKLGRFNQCPDTDLAVVKQYIDALWGIRVVQLTSDVVS